MHNRLQMSEESRSVFDALTKRLAPILSERCASRDVDLFLIRLERYFEDLYLPLLKLYGDRADTSQQFDALFDRMLDAYV
jgi:amylosucrase